VAAVLVWALPTSAAYADCQGDPNCKEAGLDLQWTTLPECPDQGKVFADVERLSHRHIEKVGHPQLGVSGVVDVRDGTWVVELQVSEDGASPHARKVEGKSCREVSDAAAVVIALALDAPPEHPATDVIPPPPKPPAPPAPPPQRPKLPTPPPPTKHRVGFRLALLAGVDAVALPGFAFGGGLSAALTYVSNRFEARGLFFAPRDEQVSAKSGASVALYTGALRYCRVLVDQSAFDIATCGGFEGGALDGHGFGFVKNGSGLGRWLAPELSIGGAGHPAKGLAIGLELEGLVPIVRDNFRVDTNLAYRTAPVDGRLLLSISYGRE